MPKKCKKPGGKIAIHPNLLNYKVFVRDQYPQFINTHNEFYFNIIDFTNTKNTLIESSVKFLPYALWTCLGNFYFFPFLNKIFNDLEFVIDIPELTVDKKFLLNLNHFAKLKYSETAFTIAIAWPPNEKGLMNIKTFDPCIVFYGEGKNLYMYYNIEKYKELINAICD